MIEERHARLEPERREALARLDDASARGGVRIEPEARDAFVDWLLDRLAACLQPVWQSGEPVDRFPAAIEIVSASIAAWHRRTSDLFEHLVRDRDELGAPTSIVGVRPHGEGLHARATTLGLDLANGARWFHRTRDRSMGAWFLDVCRALNAHGLSAPLHVRRLLVRDGCSWDEGVEPAPCRDPAGIHRYFVRAGMLVRLLERFAAVDFHARNVVGAGEYPVLVDVETLFVPYPESETPALAALVRSPLRAGLVGLNVVGVPGRPAINGGGLHPGGTVHLPFDEDDKPVVEEVVPTIPAPLGDHVDSLLAGWDEMEECLAHIDLSSHLERARGVLRRDLRANGRIYHEALESSLGLELLRSVEDRDRWLAARDFNAAEVASLRALELPRPMMVVGDHPALSALPPFTASERARRHDLMKSVILLREDRPAPVVARPLASSRAAIAIELGDRLLALRFAGSQWHGARWFPSYGIRLIAVLGGDLHGGIAGIAIVFAMLARATGLARFAEAARAALATIPDDRPCLGAMGLGGTIYALATCGKLLDDASLIERASLYAGAAPRFDAPWDILTGVAGFVLGARAADAVPPAALDALHAAWERGLEPVAELSRGVPLGLPALRDGVELALARCGRAVARGAAFPSSGDLLDVPGTVDRLLERRRATGHWFPQTSIAERHQMSIVDGIPAVIHCLLAADDPTLPSIRRME